MGGADLGDPGAWLADGLVAVDFDGTLSPIVDDPDAAEPAEGAVDALVGLAERLPEVAVISGRPLSYLGRYLGPPLTLVGLYGLETIRHGIRDDHPSAGVWRETMADVASGAEHHGPSGMRVELKGMSITLHYRQHPELADEVEAWARQAAAPAGIRVRPARMSVELHPPIDEDKGTALRRLAADHSGPVLFMGDDVGDLTAFDQLDELQAAGRTVVRVGVDSPEMPPELRERADLVVDGTSGAVRLLRGLLG